MAHLAQPLIMNACLVTYRNYCSRKWFLLLTNNLLKIKSILPVFFFFNSEINRPSHQTFIWWGFYSLQRTI